MISKVSSIRKRYGPLGATRCVLQAKRVDRCRPFYRDRRFTNRNSTPYGRFANVTNHQKPDINKRSNTRTRNRSEHVDTTLCYRILLRSAASI